MQISKYLIVLIFLILNIVNLTACNLPTPKDKSTANEVEKKIIDSETATFNVEAIPGRSTAFDSFVEESYGIPTAKIYNFYACLKDVYYNRPITGHNFQVAETNKSVTTDSSGCLTWAEKLDFNYLGDSQYIKINRHLNGTGTHKGTRTVSFAINPWSHGETIPAVIDVRNEDVAPNLIHSENQAHQALKGMKDDGNLRTRSLWVDDIRLVVSEEKLTPQGADMILEARMTPSIQLSKMNKEPWLRPLTQGAFKIKLKLIHSYSESNKQIHRLLTQTELIDAKMDNGRLLVNAPISLSVIPTRGQLVLGFEIHPVNGPKGLIEFNGIYTIGDYDQLKGISSLKLSPEVKPDKAFNINSFVNASEITANTQNDVYQKPKVEVSQLEFKFIRIGEEKTSSREVIFNIRACFKNGIDHKTIRSHTFKINKFTSNSTGKASESTLQTDNNACLSWEESIQFNYYDCQHYFNGSINIENKDLGLNQKLDIIINPWDMTSSIGRDARYIAATENIILECKKENQKPSQILMDTFYYSTISYGYQADELLNLNVIKKLQLKIEPRVLVYSSFTNGRNDIQRLRDGAYLLKTAIVKNRDYDNKNTFIASAEKIVYVTNGQINTDISYTMSDLKSLGNRNILLVEIYPVDENKIKNEPSTNLNSLIDVTSNLQTSTFAGPIVLNLDEATRPLRILDDSTLKSLLGTSSNLKMSANLKVINQITQEGLQAKERLRQFQLARATNKQFALDHNLLLLNLNTMDNRAALSEGLHFNDSKTRVNISKSEIQNLLYSTKLDSFTAIKFCSFWASELFPHQFSEKGGGIKRTYISDFHHDCTRAVAKNPYKFFKTESFINIKKVGETQYMKGFNQGLSVGTNFSLSKSVSENFNTTKSLSMGGKIGLGKIFFDLVSIDTGANMSISWANSDSNSTSTSTSVSTSTSLTVQESQLKIRVSQFEQCVQIKLNPILFVKDDSWFGRKDYLSILNPLLSEKEQVQLVTHGILFCEGAPRYQDYDIIENYYLLSQETSSTQMQDSGDERNRNFFIALRSKNDYQRFILAVKGETKMPQSASDQNVTKDLNYVIERLFQLKEPATPGIFSLKTTVNH